MRREITYLQNVQDAFANMSQLSMFITDEWGSAITKISNQCEFTKLAYEEWANDSQLYDYIVPLVSIKKPIVVDTPLGLKLIVSPIRVKDRFTYYLFTGLILEPMSREYVNQFIRSKVKHSEVLITSFETMKELSDDNILESIKLIKKLTNVIEEYLTLKEENENNNNTTSSFYESIDSIRTGLATKSSFLEEFKESNSKLEFIGIAIENDNEHFVIDTLIGKGTESLMGQTFQMGEGFLGHTVAVQEFQFWGDVSNDPRNTRYTQKGLDIKSLFCEPIFLNNRVKAVLFGGSTISKLAEAEIYKPMKTCSSLLSLLLLTKDLKENLQNHLMELSTFNEIFRVITSMEDLKRVLYILVDISINIIRGPFACIVFKPTSNLSKVEIVSRGLSSLEIKDYGYHLASSAFSSTNTIMDNKQPNLGKTSWGTNVLEFPLMFNNQLYGMLSVGVPQHGDPEKYKSFLSSLAVAGGISIHLRKNENTKGSDTDTVELLHKVMEKVEPIKYSLAMKISNTVESFALTLNELDSNMLKQAASLIVYDLPLTKDYITNPELLSVLNDCHIILDGKKVDRKESELVSLIYQYYNQNEDINSINELTNINQELRNQFITFEKKQTIIESEISLVTEQYIDENQQKLPLNNFNKEKMNVSSRELEVLNLVLKGYSNNEIASALFISDHTVKNHMTKILQKLGVSDRSQAIAKVYQMGYIPPEVPVK